MDDIVWGLSWVAALPAGGLLGSGFLRGEYHDLDGAVAWMSSLVSLA